MLEIKNIDVCPVRGNKATILIEPHPKLDILRVIIRCSNEECMSSIEINTFGDLENIIEDLNNKIDHWNNLKTLKNREK